MSLALYRKYRSKSLAEIVGQQHITDILSRALKAGRISHAYLLTGPRGVGKTSVARILAHEINQLPYDDDSTHLDIIEIDAASNNGVEDVRDLRDKVQIAPVSAARKVYIIDEVHMLSKPAFNALLKTLEEPPEHVVFILATTDADKLPATIISRTQRYGFRAISRDDAVRHLRHIADQEKIKVDDAALALIAERGDGSFRDSISLLDQLASLTDKSTGISAELIEATLGLAPAALITDLLAAVDSHDVAAINQLIEAAANDGISPITLTQQLTSKLRELVIEKPQLISLLDALLDVPKSSQPGLKLLTVLGSAALESKPVKSAALAAPVLEVSATIEELSRQATQPKPAEPTASAPIPLRGRSTGAKAARDARLALTGAASSQDSADAVDPQGFDWSKLINYVRQHHVALHSVLSKSRYELDGKELTVYAGNKFYKKKLEDPKYSAALYESLQTSQGYQPVVHIIPTAPPLKDSRSATIAAIMGGGEEVSVETS